MRFSRNHLKSSLLYLTALLFLLLMIKMFHGVRLHKASSELDRIRLDLNAVAGIQNLPTQVDPPGSFFFYPHGVGLSPIIIKKLHYFNARIDSQTIINIYDWVWIGDKWDTVMNSIPVCLATQASMDRMHWLPEVVLNWNGPLSLAVFITSPEEWIGLNMVVNHFKKCLPHFRDFVSIHVAVPLSAGNWMGTEEWNMEVSREGVEQFLGNTSCHTNPKIVVDEIHAIFPPLKKHMINYPQNHLRNIARKACGPHWTYSTDIDIIPVPNSARDLTEFIITEAPTCHKCAFVIPTFELDRKFKFPKSKAELVEHWKNKEANPFHFGYYKAAHLATNYSLWGSTNLDEESIKISHDAITNKNLYYEPFYLSRNTIPEYPERFIGYGFTRSSQIQEALSEGWRFKVLTPIFGIHWELQSVKTILSPGKDLKLRKNQTTENGKRFKLFLKELDFRNKLVKNQ